MLNFVASFKKKYKIAMVIMFKIQGDSELLSPKYLQEIDFSLIKFYEKVLDESLRLLWIFKNSTLSEPETLGNIFFWGFKNTST